MKSFVLILAVLMVFFALAFAATAPVHAGNGCGNFNGQGFGGFNGFSGHFHNQNFGNFGSFGFHGQNFNGFNNHNFGPPPRVQGNNGAFSAGGRAAVFVGFDRNGNPVFR